MKAIVNPDGSVSLYRVDVKGEIMTDEAGCFLPVTTLANVEGFPAYDVLQVGTSRSAAEEFDEGIRISLYWAHMYRKQLGIQLSGIKDSGAYRATTTPDGRAAITDGETLVVLRDDECVAGGGVSLSLDESRRHQRVELFDKLYRDVHGLVEPISQNTNAVDYGAPLAAFDLGYRIAELCTAARKQVSSRATACSIEACAFEEAVDAAAALAHSLRYSPDRLEGAAREIYWALHKACTETLNKRCTLREYHVRRLAAGALPARKGDDQ